MKLTTSTSILISLFPLLITIVGEAAAVPLPANPPSQSYSHPLPLENVNEQGDTGSDSHSLLLENAHKQGAPSSNSYYNFLLSARGPVVKRDAAVIAGTVIGVVAAALAIGIAFWVVCQKV